MYVIDSEMDGLNPTKIYCLVVADTESGGIDEFTDYDDMRAFLGCGYTLIGHNIQLFDIPHLERILGIKINSTAYDTLALSWYLYPDRLKHGLEAWGEDLGIKKPEIIDWHNQTLEEYLHRCTEDVKINLKLWYQMRKDLVAIYGPWKNAKRFLQYLEHKMNCAALQHKSGWAVDIEYATQALEKMVAEKEAKVQELFLAMPSVPVYVIKKKPKKFTNADGQTSKLGLAWLELLKKKGLPLDFEGSVEVLTRYDPPNPTSTPQIKNWLFSLGWKPQTFKYKRGPDGKMKEIPQINMERGEGICPSIKKLYEKEPKLELLDGLSVLSHRIPLLAGILESVDKRGRTVADIQGLTNTLRFKHRTVVNLPKANKPYGEFIRGSLISAKGKLLCGSDMASLEDRIKQHFIYELDPKYVESMNQEDFDPHLIIAELAGMMSKEDVLAYKAGDKSKKSIRDIAKNGNYALIGAYKIV